MITFRKDRFRSKVPVSKHIKQEDPTFIPNDKKDAKYNEYLEYLKNNINYKFESDTIKYSFKFGHYLLKGKILFTDNGYLLVYIEDNDFVYSSLNSDLKMRSPICISSGNLERSKNIFFDLILCNALNKGLLC